MRFEVGQRVRSLVSGKWVAFNCKPPEIGDEGTIVQSSKSGLAAYVVIDGKPSLSELGWFFFVEELEAVESTNEWEDELELL